MNSSTIYEYAHGGSDSNCDAQRSQRWLLVVPFDPMTGNLAASGDGVAIYQHATGNPNDLQLRIGDFTTADTTTEAICYLFVRE